MKNAKYLSFRHEPYTVQLWLLVGLGFFGTKTALATEYYVSPTGSDSNPGTLASPWGTIQKGANTAVAGDTVWLRGGTYAITTPNTSGSGITFSKSGTSDTNRIKYWAYPGEVPKIDFSNMTISTTGYTMGVTVSGNWLHFKGIEECCTTETTFANNGFDVSGSNDIFELLNMHNNMGNGIFMGTKTGGGNLILNCDSHDNYDPTTSQGQGQNADGFGVHYQTSGASTIIRGCRAWWNSDDGYDFINQEVPVTIENSWAMGSGYANYGTYNPTSGNGNGFKIGSSKTGIRHLVQNNVAWKCKASGFYANHSSGGNTWYNNTSFQNGTQFNMLASTWDAAGNRTDGVTLTGALAHIMRNNLAYPIKNSYITGYGVDTQFNNWDLNITPAATDFLNIADPSVSGTGQAIETTSPAFGPRQADGSLPNVDFLKLAAGSKMIDKGTNVGLPYVGAAPDLGAYEFGATTSAGGAGTGGAVSTTGGAVGTTGGKAGTGGAPVSTGGVGVTTGGRMSTGGAANNTGGFAVTTGGIVGTGGAPVNTGGAGVATGGKVGTGGAVNGTGGAANTGGLGALGGMVTTGGVASEAGSSGTEVTMSGGAGSSSNTGSCSCRVAGLPSRSTTLASVGLLGLLLLRSRRQRSPR
jgi:hypothetical protein